MTTRKTNTTAFELFSQTAGLLTAKRLYPELFDTDGNLLREREANYHRLIKTVFDGLTPEVRLKWQERE